MGPIIVRSPNQRTYHTQVFDHKGFPINNPVQNGPTRIFNKCQYTYLHIIFTPEFNDLFHLMWAHGK